MAAVAFDTNAQGERTGGDAGVGVMGRTAGATVDSRSSAADVREFTRDTTLEVLSNRRRRFAMHYLKRHDGTPVEVSELAERVASWENGKEARTLTTRERKRVRNALRQFHLPKMAEYGFVEYDSGSGTVRLTEAADDADFYVDSLTGSDVPWGVYYLGLSAVSAAVLVGLWVGVPPLDRLSPLLCGACFVAVLSASSVGHFYDNHYRMRLGAREKPPEVKDGTVGVEDA
jgi:hypothetical protein